MELKKRFSIRRVCTVLYVVAFLIYLVIGLAPAEAAQYNVTAKLEIPSIGLESDVTSLELVKHRLDTPDAIVGSYSRNYNKTLLIGHASTVFYDLSLVTVGESIIYDGKEYTVDTITLWKKEDIDMDEVLAPATRDTLLVMTCAGELNGLDASHRLIVQASRS